MTQANESHRGHTRIGYARISSTSQNLDSQRDALQNAGCIKVFSEAASGMSKARPEWTRLMDYLRCGDTLVICELSRMSRSLRHLLKLVDELQVRDVKLHSLRENIDTTTATGRCFLAMMGAIAQMERELRAERTAAGRASAKARGRTGGRPKSDPKKLERARILYENSDMSATQAAKAAGIGRRTLFSYLAKRKVESEAQVQ